MCFLSFVFHTAKVPETAAMLLSDLLLIVYPKTILPSTGNLNFSRFKCNFLFFAE